MVELILCCFSRRRGNSSSCVLGCWRSVKFGVIFLSWSWTECVLIMSRPREERFIAYNVQEDAEVIYRRIKSKGGEKLFYFDGWDGFGSSSVLRYIAAMLPSRRTIPELCFDRIFFIDCSKWKNRRAVQREIAKELQLDNVMAI